MKILLLFLLSIPLLAQRIVTLSPAVNEIVFALKKGEEIVGNTEFCNYPPASKNIPKVGGYYSISLEKVLALHADLIIMEKNNLSLKPKLEKLGIEVLDVSTRSLASLKQNIRIISDKIGATEKSKPLISKIDAALLKSKNILKEKKILIVFGSHLDLSRQVYISGNQLYFADIIRQSGNKNAYDENSNKQPSLSYEGLIAIDPDIIIILAPYAKKQKRSSKEIIAPWLKMPITASRKKSIYVIDKEYAGIPSDRVALFIRDFERILHDAKNRFSQF